jgi:hypothetical protein
MTLTAAAPASRNAMTGRATVRAERDVRGTDHSMNDGAGVSIVTGLPLLSGGLPESAAHAGADCSVGAVASVRASAPTGRGGQLGVITQT